MSHETPPQSIESKNQKRLEKIENILQGKQRNIVQIVGKEWGQIIVERHGDKTITVRAPYFHTGEVGRNGHKYSVQFDLKENGDIFYKHRENEYNWKDSTVRKVPESMLDDELLESTEPIKIRETKEIDTDEARIKKLQKIEALRPTRWAYYGMSKHGFCQIKKGKEGYFEVSVDDEKSPGFDFEISKTGKLVYVYEVFTDDRGVRGRNVGKHITLTSEHEKILNETLQSFTDMNVKNAEAKPDPSDADLDNLLKHFRQRFEKRDPDLN